MVTKLKIRRDNSTVWNLINPVLEQGEPAVELDTGRMKIGDGERPYIELPYTSSTGAGGISTIAWGDITGTIASNGALATALSNKEAKADKGIANGYAPLNENAVIPGIHILKGQPNGVPSLDEDGIVLREQLPTITIPDSIPKGVIVMWSGTLATIPAGWALCDGTNGTPDLQNKFIRGATTTTLPGTEGGADTVTLATTNLPSHTHGTTASGLGLSFSEGAVKEYTDSTTNTSHIIPTTTQDGLLGTVRYATQQSGLTAYPSIPTVKGSYNWVWANLKSLTHTHTMSGTISGNWNTAATGSEQAINILPTYYTLAYIIKI